MNREELEALRRQVEEDYKLDLAAIERLLRRHSGVSSSTPISTQNNSTSSGSAFSASSWRAETESRVEPPSTSFSSSAHEEAKNDDLAGSIRTIFNGNGRK